MAKRRSGSANEAPRGLVVALDGPAASGKSSVGAAAAAKLGYRFCDTGLLYRAVTWLALDRGIIPGDVASLVPLVAEIELLDDGGGRLSHVAVDGVDRTAEVRTPDVDVEVSAYSSVAELRAALLARQRALAAPGRIIMAGRDIGTFVLEDADLKIYLDASVEERARRRILERGIDEGSAEAAEIHDELARRDLLDSTREVAPLRAAPDAQVIKTDGNAFQTTVAVVVDAIRRAEAAAGDDRAARENGNNSADDSAAPEAPSVEPPPPPAVDAPASDAPPTAAAPSTTPRAADTPTPRASSTTPPAADATPTPRASSIAPPAPGASSRAARSEKPIPGGDRPARAERRPMRPSPVATRLDWLVRFGSAVLRLIVRAIVRLRIEGDLAAIPREGAVIVAANHASSADPVLIGAFLNSAINRPINWLGKRELTEFWLTGWAFRRAGIHPVDRHAGDLESFRTALRILEAGQLLAVFPEGTRSRDGALQKVREGVGVLALRSGASVLPVAVIDSDLMWPRGHLLPRWGKRVTVRYGTPFKVGEEQGRGPGASRDRRAANEAATRLIMTRIAELLPPRQRGVYSEGAEAVGPAGEVTPRRPS